MSRWMVMLGALSALGCGKPAVHEYQYNDLRLATAYSAKEVCSCVFVMEQSEEFCRAWTRANPAVAEFRVDREAKTVSSFALMMWGAKARYVSDKFGCVLE